jgi:hypothetical protein
MGMGEHALEMWFELSYSSYLVLHRVALQSMPDDWKLKFVAMLEEMRETIDTSTFPSEFEVRAKEDGKYVSDPWRDYRRQRAPLRVATELKP